MSISIRRLRPLLEFLHRRLGRSIPTMVTRFYFHLAKDSQRIIDRTGVELDREAVMSSSVHQIEKRVWPGTAELDGWDGWTIEIFDADGRLVRALAIL